MPHLLVNNASFYFLKPLFYSIKPVHQTRIFFLILILVLQFPCIFINTVPPREEQEQIVRFLDARCAKIDRLITENQAQITKLHDLKSSLIADVVTGKIDVRDVQILNYEQVEETLYESDDNATLHSEDEITEEM